MSACKSVPSTLTQLAFIWHLYDEQTPAHASKRALLPLAVWFRLRTAVPQHKIRLELPIFLTYLDTGSTPKCSRRRLSGPLRLSIPLIIPTGLSKMRRVILFRQEEAAHTC